MINSIVASLGGERLLIQSLERNLNWLERSFANNNYAGSSAYANVFGWWSDPYPETTGYLLPSLSDASMVLDDDRWHTLACDQIAYFADIQNDEGWFVGGKEKRALVFDNSQILLGICGLLNKGEDLPEDFDLIKSYTCILGILNDQGVFTEANFIEGYNPSYYARIVWALLLTEQTFGLEPHNKTRALYQRIINLQNDKLSFENCAFGPGEKTFTHTILYSIRGLWESARLLNDEAIIAKMERTVMHLDSLIESNKQMFAGAYDENWRGDYGFLCSVGHCQLAVLKILMYQHTRKESFLKHLDILLTPIFKAQKRSGKNLGAIPSSIPIYRAYQRFRYTNWTQKFFVDAIINIIWSVRQKD